MLFADNLGNPLAKFIVQATRSAEGAARKAGDLAAWELLEISLRNKASQMLKESLRVAQKDRIAVFDSDIMARFATFSRKVFDSKQHHPTRGLLASPNEDPKHVDFGPSEAFKEWQRFVDTILIRFGKVSSHPYRVNDEIPARPKSSDWDWRQSEVAANPSGCKKLRLGGHEVDLVVRRWFERADAILPVDFIWWPARVVDWSADLGRGVLAVFDLCSSSNVLLKCHFEGSHGRPFRPGQELELGMKKVAGRDSCEAVLIDM